jgi:hypothetical protein
MNDGIIVRDEDERPAPRNKFIFKPMMGGPVEEKQKRARTHDEQAKLKGIVGKIKELLNGHLSVADQEARDLNAQLSRTIGRGSDELAAKATQQKTEALEDCITIAHDVLDWLTDELLARDEIAFAKLAEAYNNGIEDATKRLTAEFQQKIDRLTDGDSPLSMSLKDQRTKLSRVL